MFMNRSEVELKIRRTVLCQVPDSQFCVSNGHSLSFLWYFGGLIGCRE